MSSIPTSLDYFPDWLSQDLIEQKLKILQNHDNSALIRIGIFGDNYEHVKTVLERFSKENMNIKDDKSEIFVFNPNYTYNERVNVMIQIHFMKIINPKFIHWIDIPFFLFDITNSESFDYIINSKKYCDSIKRSEKSVLLGIMDGMKSINDRFKSYQSLLIQSIRMGFDHYVDIINNEGKYEWFESLLNLTAAKFISSFVAQQKSHHNFYKYNLDSISINHSNDSHSLFHNLHNTNVCRKISTNRERVNQLALKTKLLDDYNKNCSPYLHYNTTTDCKCYENQDSENSDQLDLNDEDVILKYDVKILHGRSKKPGEIILTKCGYIYFKFKDRIVRDLVRCVSIGNSRQNIGKRRSSIFLTDSQDHKMAFNFNDTSKNVIVFFQSENDKNDLKSAIEPASIRCLNDLDDLTVDQKQRHQALFNKLFRVPGNGNCADCKLRHQLQRPPSWLLTLHGMLNCIDCAGKHRSLGVNVSRVQSVLIDKYQPVQLGIVQTGYGNIVGNSVFEFIDGPFNDLSTLDKLPIEYFHDKYSNLAYLSSRSRKISRRRFSEAILLDHPFHLLTQVFSATKLVNEYARYDGGIPWASTAKSDWILSETTMFQLAVHCGSINAVYILLNHDANYLKRDLKGRLFTHYVPEPSQRSIRHILVIELLIEFGVLKKKDSSSNSSDVYVPNDPDGDKEGEETVVYERCLELEDLLVKYQNHILNGSDKSTSEPDNDLCDFEDRSTCCKAMRLMPNADE